ncbi:MAG: hypothetical protein ACXWKG_06865 [Limisphaerales bacterium]
MLRELPLDEPLLLGELLGADDELLEPCAPLLELVFMFVLVDEPDGSLMLLPRELEGALDDDPLVP